MRDFTYLQSDPTVDRWLRFKEPLTKTLYCRTLEHFIDGFTGPEMGLKDPSSIVAWAKKTENTQVQDVIEKYGEKQPRTAQLVRMSMVRSFLKKNGVNLPSGSSARQYQKEFHRAYKRDEIQTLLGYLDDPFQKLYVLICKDSGLRAQDVLSLCYRHVKKDLEGDMEYVHLRLEPSYYNRKKASGLTFIGPNAVKLLKQLVSTKEIRTENDSRLFPFLYVSIAKSLARARDKALLEKEIQPSHGLRKFFENSLDRVGMDHHKKLQLEGHSQGVRIHYTSQDIDELRTLYAQAYQYLDLSEEGAADSRVKALEELVKRQNQKIDELEKKIPLMDVLKLTLPDKDYELLQKEAAEKGIDMSLMAFEMLRYFKKMKDVESRKENLNRNVS